MSPRSRASAKAAGSSMERQAADYLAEHVDDRIDRRAKTGAKDKGDIGGLRIFDQGSMTAGRITVEVKNTAKLAIGTWIGEAETERLNDTDRDGRPALAAIVIHKRHGKGQPGDQLVTMTARDFVAILTGVRPE